MVWDTTGFPRGGALRPPAPLPVRGAGTNSEQTIERHGTYDCDSFGMNRAQTIEAHRTYACVFVEFQPKWPVEVSSCVVRDTMGSRCDRGSAGPPVRTRSTAWAFQKTVRVSQKGQQRCFLCGFAAFSGQTKIPIRHSIRIECRIGILVWPENAAKSSWGQSGYAFAGPMVIARHPLDPQDDSPLSGSNTRVFIAEYGFRCKNRVPDRNPGLTGKCREIVVGTVRLRFCRSHGDGQAPL